MESLTCRSSTRCPTCPHFRAGACALEEDLEVVLSAMTRAPARPAPARLLLVDARKPVASA